MLVRSNIWLFPPMIYSSRFLNIHSLSTEMHLMTQEFNEKIQDLHLPWIASYIIASSVKLLSQGFKYHETGLSQFPIEQNIPCTNTHDSQQPH